jgi:hypothetical protein
MLAHTTRRAAISLIHGGAMATNTKQSNAELMQTLDEAWNKQDVKVFRERHKPDVVVRWPGTTKPTVARFRGTMSDPMKAPDGTMIPPTGKSFDVDFYTVAKWDDGQIVEENLMYDLVTFMKQIGLAK